jgi:hypothetical protein
VRRWLDPDKPDAWIWTRVLFALAGLATWVPRSRFLVEAYSSEGIVLAGGRFPLTRYVIFTPQTVFLVWGLLCLSLVLVAAGRFVRPAIVAYLACSFALLFSEGLHMRAYDRLLAWQALVLLISPCLPTSRNPTDWFPRVLMIIVYCGVYGSTGWYKVLDEPEWLNGDALAHHLVNHAFGGRAIGFWMSNKPWLTVPMSWWTLIFECSFPVLVWFRRTNPIILLMGLGFHLGIFVMMGVYTFSPVGVAVYPILLHPTWFSALKARLSRLLPPPPSGVVVSGAERS